MVRHSKQGGLFPKEKEVVKGLLESGWRNQDIQDLINRGRIATINSARITEVKKNINQEKAGKEEIKNFIANKENIDFKTGLNIYENERIFKAREAMILAVQLFNSTIFNFKTEIFAVLAQIAWTYLLHEFYERKGKSICGKDGRSMLLSQMIKKSDCNLTEGMKNNLKAIIKIRDNVEHKTLGKADTIWASYYQACCLNFDKFIRSEFGERLTLSNDLGIALHFSKMNLEQLAILNQNEIPNHIQTIDNELHQALSLEQEQDLEYQFKVIFTLDSASKSSAHFQFCNPESTQGKEIRNILKKKVIADSEYPYKPQAVCGEIFKKLNKTFTMHEHTQAWKKHKVRPDSKSKTPDDTKREYCIYHQAHKDYTYSQKWIDFLIKEKSEDAI